ncbi:MAG TPA: ABC transporter ATP-binding protein [Acidimicrobiia bacterium]|nr:ABC transporter ATP-binding protein [Acidimicrobiia bacterium]
MSGREQSGKPIETAGLTKRFGSLTALDGLTIAVERGEIYGFLGPNGAGKTTTIRAVLGLAKPTAGSARVFGFDAWSERQDAHRHLAFVPGEFAPWPTLRGHEMLDLLGHVHGGYDAALRDRLCDRFEFDPTKKGREYSKGNRQKIALIAAFMVRPDLLVLDEPTSGLDPLMEIEFRRCVEEAREQGQTVFLSSHLLSEVEAVCDRVAILRSGRLVEVGTLEDLRELNSQEVEIEFAAAPVPDLSTVAGVQDVEQEGNRVTLRLRGSPNELVRALAAHDVRDLDIREPSLEELFLTYYGSDGAAPPRST